MLFTPGAKELNLRWSRYNCLNRIAYRLCYMRLGNANVKTFIKTLDFCVNQAVAKIFNTCDKDCITQIRLAYDLPDVTVLIERRRMNFMNNMLDNEHLRYLSLFWVHC